MNIIVKTMDKYKIERFIAQGMIMALIPTIFIAHYRHPKETEYNIQFRFLTYMLSVSLIVNHKANE